MTASDTPTAEWTFSHESDKILKASVEISDAVTSVIGQLHVKPAYIIAKGGITSSDVGTKALKVKKALVMGQIQKGIPAVSGVRLPSGFLQCR